MPEVNSKIEDKIRKLLAMQRSNNPNEVANAMFLANKLLKQHNLSINQIKMIEDKEIGVVKDEVEFYYSNTSNWEIMLVVDVCEYYNCKALISKGRGIFPIMGIETDIKVAQEMITYLRNILITSSLNAARYIIQGKEKWRRDYMYGAVLIILKRLKEIKEQKTYYENVLVLKKDVLINDYVKKNYPNLGEQRSAHIDINETAYYAGIEKGKRIDLQQFRKLGGT